MITKMSVLVTYIVRINLEDLSFQFLSHLPFLKKNHNPHVLLNVHKQKNHDNIILLLSNIPLPCHTFVPNSVELPKIQNANAPLRKTNNRLFLQSHRSQSISNVTNARKRWEPSKTRIGPLNIFTNVWRITARKATYFGKF